MSTFKVTKGRDGRHNEVLTADDLSQELYDVLLSNDLIACEKILVSPFLDIMDITGFSHSQIQLIQSAASKKLCPKIYSVVSVEQTSPEYSFGSRKLDNTFQGILKGKKVLEIWGASGAGKSQLALQMCSALPPSQYSAYISTEGNISTTRLFDMCSARGVKNANCHIQSCSSVDSFSDCIMRQLPLLLAVKPVKLVIIDSIAAPFRAGEVDGGGIRRAQKIRSIGQQLKYLASHFNVLVVVLNQATDNPVTGKQPALGLTWSYLVNSRMRLQKLEFECEVGTRRLSVDKASCIKAGTFVDCKIQNEGLL